MSPNDIYFSEWTPWHLRDRIDPIDDTPTNFGLSGIYLLAHFNDPRKAKKFFRKFHLNPDVIYIGVSRSTIHRLGRHHKIVARYKSEFFDSPLSKLYCSVWQSDVSNYDLTRGNTVAEACLLHIERKLIWEYALAFNRLPALNSR
jgi:hypothetical protein